MLLGVVHPGLGDPDQLPRGEHGVVVVGHELRQREAPVRVRGGGGLQTGAALGDRVLPIAAPEGHAEDQVGGVGALSRAADTATARAAGADGGIEGQLRRVAAAGLADPGLRHSDALRGGGQLRVALQGGANAVLEAEGRGLLLGASHGGAGAGHRTDEKKGFQCPIHIAATPRGPGQQLCGPAGCRRRCPRRRRSRRREGPTELIRRC